MDNESTQAFERKSLLCGLDEAGRGPLAGPVCAAAVILFSENTGDFPIELLGDSKKLSAAARERAATAICSLAAAWGIGWASHTEIDEINIHKASLLAMKRAFEEMLAKVEGKLKDSTLPISDISAISAIVDGLFVPDISIPCRAIIKADAKIPEVMAASILAKTKRDAYMKEMALLYPQYGYDKHKGYPTAAHRQAIGRFGPSPIQRKSFNVKNLR